MLYKRQTTWHMDVTVDGVRYRESLKTSDKREAKNREKDRIAAIKAGEIRLRPAQVRQELAELKRRIVKLEKLM